MNEQATFSDFECEPVDEHLLKVGAVCMGCDQLFEDGQNLISCVVSIEPDRPDDLAAKAGELICTPCFLNGVAS